MNSLFAKVLTALALTGGLAVPAVAQARGGSDDPANHEQRQHQVRHHAQHHRIDNQRRHRRGSDDAPNHR